jgi:hypothetical protein
MKKAIVMMTMFALMATVVVPLLAADAKYIGANKCKMCHKSEKKGNQFGKWSNGPHAKAYAVLATDEAKAVAKKAGIAGDPQKAKECLICHVTGFDAPASAKAATLKMEEGVGCESCHGPGSLYKSMKVMKALTAGTQDAAAVAYIRGDEKTCLTCHNEKSPTYKPFNFAAKWKEIDHSMPKK